MDDKNQIIDDLFNFSADVRYVAVYKDNELVFKQRQHISDSSLSDTDKYEELLVNQTLLTIARQRGNIDCGGLRFLIVGYGNFYQLVKEVHNGHISICLDKNVDLTNMPAKIFEFLKSKYSELW
jgi:hypothetical protein